MSLYNALFGFNPACVLLMPLIGRSQSDFPRFRDCFAGDVESRTIVVFTRTGGGNREGYADENEAITKFDGYVEDWDDDYDSTFAYWEFAVPEKWHADYDCVALGNLSGVSENYAACIKAAYPKLSDQVDELIRKAKGGSDANQGV